VRFAVLIFSQPTCQLLNNKIFISFIAGEFSQENGDPTFHSVSFITFKI